MENKGVYLMKVIFLLSLFMQGCLIDPNYLYSTLNDQYNYLDDEVNRYVDRYCSIVKNDYFNCVIEALADSEISSKMLRRSNSCIEDTEDKISELKSEAKDQLTLLQFIELNDFLIDGGSAEAPFEGYCSKTSRDQFDIIDCLEDAKESFENQFQCE